MAASAYVWSSVNAGRWLMAEPLPLSVQSLTDVKLSERLAYNSTDIPFFEYEAESIPTYPLR